MFDKKDLSQLAWNKSVQSSTTIMTEALFILENFFEIKS